MDCIGVVVLGWVDVGSMVVGVVWGVLVGTFVEVGWVVVADPVVVVVELCCAAVVVVVAVVG